jgi:hypothetical protein
VKARTPKQAPRIAHGAVARALVAMDDLLARGVTPTMRHLMAHLKHTTGRGCSMRDAHVALRLHAEQHAKLELDTLKGLLGEMRKRIRPLNVMSRKRIYRDLQHILMMEAARWAPR